MKGIPHLSALILFLSSVLLRGQNLPAAKETLRVGIYPNEPFLIASGNSYQGFSYDLWKEVAADSGRKFRCIPYDTIPNLLEAVSRGEVDVGVSGIFITGERLKRVDFSQPFLHGGLQIMVNEKRGSSFTKLWSGLRDSGHLEIFGAGILVIFASTILLTLGERRWNAEFHPDWPNGLAESFYHVMSIVMTGKSSHKGLPGPWGKVLAGIWIAFGVGVVAYITSSVTSIMTVNRLQGTIRGPQDLPSHRIAVVSGTMAEQYCGERHLDVLSCPDLKGAVRALLDRNADAIVHDAMTLQWYDNSHPELPITEVGPVFDKKFYGFALPIGSPLRHEINRAILEQNESGFMETLRKQYFGDIQ